MSRNHLEFPITDDELLSALRYAKALSYDENIIGSDQGVIMHYVIQYFSQNEKARQDVLDMMDVRKMI